MLKTCYETKIANTPAREIESAYRDSNPGLLI